MLDGMTYGGGLFVGVGGNSIMTSTDGRSWSKRTIAPIGLLKSVAHGAGVFVAVTRAFSSVTNLISRDGSQWDPLAIPTAQDLNDIIWSNGRFVAVGGAGTVCESSDGFNWTVRAIPGAGTLNTVCHGNGRLLAGGNGELWLYDESETWTRTGGSNVIWYGVAYGNGMFVAAGITQAGQTAPHVLRSADGLNWEPSGESRTFADLAFGRGVFVGATSAGIVRAMA